MIFNLSGRNGAALPATYDGKKLVWTCPPHAICADGSPRCYAPVGWVDKQGRLPLDKLANGGHPGNWWGVETDNGKKTGNPLVQGSNDPYPGAYKSQLALGAHGNVVYAGKYPDAETVPYIIVTNGALHDLDDQKQHIIQLGDLVKVTSVEDSSKWTVAIAAEVGDHFGEVSMALAEFFGVDSSPRTGGNLTYMLRFEAYSRSTKGWPRNTDWKTEVLALDNI